MDIQHRDWQAALTRRHPLHTFDVTGIVTIPDEQLTDEAYLVPIAVTLDKSALRHTDPTILVLELTVIRERKFPYRPPPQALSYLVRYYINMAGPEEEAYTTVHIFSEGVCIQECSIRR